MSVIMCMSAAVVVWLSTPSHHPLTPSLHAHPQAILGGDLARHNAHDHCKLLPENTYGYTKATCELMTNEYTRRGFIDGRGMRLPSIVVRPGLPNAAATSCFSGVVREPLSGHDAVLPLPLDLEHPAASYQVAVEGMVGLMEMEAGKLDVDRVYNLPSINITLQSLIDAARRFADLHPGEVGELGNWVEERDDNLTAIVQSMPCVTNGDRAMQLGIRQDKSVDDMVAAYARDMIGIGGSE